MSSSPKRYVPMHVYDGSTDRIACGSADMGSGVIRLDWVARIAPDRLCPVCLAYVVSVTPNNTMTASAGR